MGWAKEIRFSLFCGLVRFFIVSDLLDSKEHSLSEQRLKGMAIDSVARTLHTIGYAQKKRLLTAVAASSQFSDDGCYSSLGQSK